MKRILLLSVITFVFLSTNAQFDIGLKAGISNSTNKYFFTENDSRLGWYAGGVMRIGMSKKIFIQPELFYASKGTSYNVFRSNNPITVKLDYITVPILLGYHPLNKMRLYAGPEFGYLLKGTQKWQDDMVVTDDYTRFDAGIDMGISYTIWKSLSIDARYNYGFKTFEFTDINGQKYKCSNQSIQVGLTYLFK